MITFDELRYIIVPSQPTDPAVATLCEKAFHLWHTVWTETYRELQPHRRVFSDDYTRQSRIGSLFHGDTCIALTLFRSANARSAAFRFDSYFERWPPVAIEQLHQYGDNIVVGSHITIHPDFRKRPVRAAGDQWVPLRDIVAGLAIATFLDSGADAMTGCMRNDKGMNALAAMYGARLLVRDVPQHNVRVDLMAFYRPDLLEQGILNGNLVVNALWKARMDYVGDWCITRADEGPKHE
jgi:hypothetical protein